MKDLNRVVLIGRLTKDVELRYSMFVSDIFRLRSIAAEKRSPAMRMKSVFSSAILSERRPNL